MATYDFQNSGYDLSGNTGIFGSDYGDLNTGTSGTRSDNAEAVGGDDGWFSLAGFAQLTNAAANVLKQTRNEPERTYDPRYVVPTSGPRSSAKYGAQQYGGDGGMTMLLIIGVILFAVVEH